jgi:hypothetical protein
MGTKRRTHRSLTAWWPTEGGVSQAGSRITLRFDRGKGKKELLPKQSGNCRLRFYNLIKLSSGQQTLDVFWSKLSPGQQTLDVFWSKLSPGQQTLDVFWSKLSSGQQTLDVFWSKLSSGQQTLDVFWSKLSPGQQTLDVFWSKLSSGQQTLDVFWSKLSSGQQTLDVFWSIKMVDPQRDRTARCAGNLRLAYRCHGWLRISAVARIKRQGCAWRIGVRRAHAQILTRARSRSRRWRRFECTCLNATHHPPRYLRRRSVPCALARTRPTGAREGQEMCGSWVMRESRRKRLDSTDGFTLTSRSRSARSAAIWAALRPASGMDLSGPPQDWAISGQTQTLGFRV